MCDIRMPAAVRRQVYGAAEEQRSGVQNVLRVARVATEWHVERMSRGERGDTASQILDTLRATAERLGCGWCDGAPTRDECARREAAAAAAVQAMGQGRGCREGEIRLPSPAGEIAISWESERDLWVTVDGGRVSLPVNLSEAKAAVASLIRWGAY